jgi:hypothetical protein
VSQHVVERDAPLLDVGVLQRTRNTIANRRGEVLARLLERIGEPGGTHRFGVDEPQHSNRECGAATDLIRLLEDKRLQAFVFRHDGRRHPRRSCTDDDDVDFAIPMCALVIHSSFNALDIAR